MARSPEALMRLTPEGGQTLTKLVAQVVTDWRYETDNGGVLSLEFGGNLTLRMCAAHGQLRASARPRAPADINIID